MHGVSDAAIARRLGRHRGTLGRELKRNRDGFGGYHDESAPRLASERRTNASRRRDKLAPGSELGKYVRQKLRQRGSPEQIAGRLGRDHPRNTSRDPAMRVTHETIYRWAYRQHQHGERWDEQLRRRRKHRRCRIPGQRKAGRGRIPGRVGIEPRPAVVNFRGRFGDGEADTVEGAKGTGRIATHVERKSRYTKLGKLKDKRADTLVASTGSIFKGMPPSLRRTSTFDNGKEFAGFKRIEQEVGLSIYFANPHAPWERGTHENTHGLLRDWLPKGSDLSKVTRTRIAQIQKMLNNRPRKCLNDRTPLEVLNDLPGVALRN